MACRIYTESLTALMDGELSPKEETAIRTHLSGCPSCRAEFQSLDYSYKLIDHMHEIEFEPASWPQIQARLATTSRSSFFSKLKFPGLWIPIGAVGALLLVATSLMMQYPEDQTTRTRQAFQSFMQQRQQDMISRGLIQPTDQGSPIFVHYNPFADPTRRPKGNPFRSER